MSGVESITNNTDAVLGALNRGLQTTIRETTMDIAEGAQLRAPVDHGNLKASIKPDVSQVETENRGQVDVGAEYGLPVEEGSVHHYSQAGEIHIAAQPYMEPAVAEVRGELGDNAAVNINIELVEATR